MSPVDDDSLHRAEEARVKALHYTIGLKALGNTVNQALGIKVAIFADLSDCSQTHLVFSLSCTFADISSQPGPGEVQRVHDRKAGCTRRASARQVGAEELPELVGGDRIWPCAHEECLELVFEGEIESLQVGKGYCLQSDKEAEVTCVGKYLTTFTTFPLQNERKP